MYSAIEVPSARYGHFDTSTVGGLFGIRTQQGDDH